MQWACVAPREWCCEFILDMLQSGHASGSLEPVGAQKPEATGVQLRSLVRPVTLEKVPASGPNAQRWAVHCQQRSKAGQAPPGQEDGALDPCPLQKDATGQTLHAVDPGSFW